MRTVVAPLNPGSQGPAVIDLQAALRLLLDRGRIALADPERQEIDARLNEERAVKVYGVVTRRLVMLFRVQYRLGDLDFVDDATATAMNAMLRELGELEEPRTFVVKGQVRLADGTPLAGVLVRAFDKDMRSEELLGEVVTDQTGHYEITYAPEQFRRAEKGNADLRVSVCNASGRELASSPIIFNAQPVETVDLSGGGESRGPSEYEQLVRELTPLLQDVLMHELSTEDITFLSNDISQDPQRITWLVESAKRHQEVDSILPQVFYGLFRQNLPTDLPALLAQDTDVLRLALETSVRDNVIPLIPAGMLDEIMARFRALKPQRALKPAGKRERASFGDLVGTVMPDPDQQLLLADLFVGHGGTSEEFWQAVGEKPEFSAKEVKQVRT